MLYAGWSHMKDHDPTINIWSWIRVTAVDSYEKVLDVMTNHYSWRDTDEWLILPENEKPIVNAPA